MHPWVRIGLLGAVGAFALSAWLLMSAEPHARVKPKASVEHLVPPPPDEKPAATVVAPTDDRHEPDDTFQELVRRADPRTEPDAKRRLEAVRELTRRGAARPGSAVARSCARYVGFALEDSERSVRIAAAEGLQRIGAAAGLVYLMPYFERLDLTFDRDGGRRLAMEREYDAARTALVALAGASAADAPAGLAEAAEDRSTWMTWLESSQGTLARLRALDDLALLTDAGPRWPLRYTLIDLVSLRPDGSPRAPAPVALRTYRLLRDRLAAEETTDRKKFARDPWWPSFPHFTERLGESDVPRIRKAVASWWVAVNQR